MGFHPGPVQKIDRDGVGARGRDVESVGAQREGQGAAGIGVEHQGTGAGDFKDIHVAQVEPLGQWQSPEVGEEPLGGFDLAIKSCKGPAVGQDPTHTVFFELLNMQVHAIGRCLIGGVGLAGGVVSGKGGYLIDSGKVEGEIEHKAGPGTSFLGVGVNAAFGRGAGMNELGEGGGCRRVWFIGEVKERVVVCREVPECKPNDDCRGATRKPAFHAQVTADALDKKAGAGDA